MLRRRWEGSVFQRPVVSAQKQNRKIMLLGYVFTSLALHVDALVFSVHDYLSLNPIRPVNPKPSTLNPKP